jgi:hypothetical protein
VRGEEGSPTITPIGTRRNLFGIRLGMRAFLSNSVRESLEIWPLLARFRVKEYIRRLKIWYLTGLYELEDTTSTNIDTRAFSFQGGVLPELVAMLSGPPVGVGGEIEWEGSRFQCVQVEEKLVWAAMYQLLDAKYVRLKENEPKPMVSVGLHYIPIWPDGDWCRSDDEIENCVKLSLKEPNQDTIEEDVEEETEGFRQPLVKAQTEWEQAVEMAD